MNAFLENLDLFNRKERFFLLARALQDSARFRLHEEFRKKLSKAVGVEVPDDAFAAMDYHLDWIFASAFLAYPDENANEHKAYMRDKKCIAGSQEDVDLLVAFPEKDEESSHLIVIEAKGDRAWSNSQMNSKTCRMKNIFYRGTQRRFERIHPYLVITSPNEPVGLDVKDLIWIKLRLPGDRLRATRCDERGRPKAGGTHWKTVSRHVQTRAMRADLRHFDRLMNRECDAPPLTEDEMRAPAGLAITYTNHEIV
ncbi:MAG: hypothetical protein HYV26_19150 [Candidatus Hydrogenedentes bacterium]|nr:hypothetical protein [Candidatus Hydrogenedentota bacterium]MBI3117529.1 hypothetical protein [Candidatus Hydrogenedentota bacterium]